MTRYIERFTLNQRMQHAVCAISCLILFATGLMVKFPDDLGYIAMLIGGFPTTTIMHRFAGGAILALGIYHVVNYLIIDHSWIKTREIWPSLLDIKNVIKDVGYALWLSKEKGQYKKYAYREKLDYWGAIIFFPILIVTGVFLWHPVFAVHYFIPADYLPAMRIIHTMDAILAGMAVMLHLYNVQLSPLQFPANWTMFTGKISEEAAKEEFPLWYEEVKDTTKEYGEISTASELAEMSDST